MKFSSCLMLLLCSGLAGCGRYIEAQVSLTQQARRGLEFVRDAQTQRAQLIDQYHESQVKRLDDAFDADVVARPQLTADWVLEHRKAYTAALQALAKMHAASVNAQAAAARNLEAIDSALGKLMTLQAAELRLTSFESLLGLSK